MERATTPHYATLREAAERVGCSQRTIRRWVSAGKLTRYGVGVQMLRVDLAELDALMAGRAGDAPAAEVDPAVVLEEYVRQLVDDAPPLSDAQRVRLASLMRSGAAAVEAVTS